MIRRTEQRDRKRDDRLEGHRDIKYGYRPITAGLAPRVSRAAKHIKRVNPLPAHPLNP